MSLPRIGERNMSACQWATAIFTNTPKDGAKVPHSEKYSSNRDLGMRPQEENSRKPEASGHATPLEVGDPQSKPLLLQELCHAKKPKPCRKILE